MNNNLLIYPILILVLAGCSIDRTQIDPVGQCNTENVTIFAQTFGVDMSGYTIQGCRYAFLGYGGSDDMNVTLEKKGALNLRQFFSGMGSGGHGYDAYCAYSQDTNTIKTIEKTICSRLEYYVAYDPSNIVCVGQDQFNVTTQIREACDNGAFTFDSGKVFKVIQSENRCGKSVRLTGTEVYSCGEGSLSIDGAQAEIDRIVAEAK